METDTVSFENKEVMRQVKEHQQHQKLISSELGDLFASYLSDSLFSCMFEHFIQVVEDEEIKEYIGFALKISRKHIGRLKEIYVKESIPVPVGFGEQDVRKDAPRLFSDIFILFYVAEMTKAALMIYGSSIWSARRQDIIDYFKMTLNDTVVTY